MIRAFLKDSLLYGVAAIVSRGISFALVPLYTRALAPADYGVIDIIMVCASLINLTVGLEITQSVARYYSDAGTEDEKQRYASTALWFTLAAYSLFWIVGAALAPRLGAAILDSPGRAGLVQVALASIWANALCTFALNQLRWQLRASWYAVVNVALTAVTLVASVVFVVVLRQGLIGAIAAQLAGYLVGAALGVYFSRDSYRAVFDRRKLGRMLRFSAPLVPSSIAVFVAMYVDRIAIKELMTMEDVGVFGVGYRVATIASLLMIGFQGALTPLVYTHHRLPETPLNVARLFRYFVAFALFACASLSLFAPELVALFATPRYRGSAAVVPFLSASVLLSGMYVFAPGLGLAKKTVGIALITTAGAVLNTVLNFALVPLLGIRGAALATLTSALLVFAGFMASSQRFYRVPHTWGGIGFASAATAAAIWAGSAVTLPAALGIPVKAALLLAVAGVSVAAGLIVPGDVRRVYAMARGRWASLAGPGRAGASP